MVNEGIPSIIDNIPFATNAHGHFFFMNVLSLIYYLTGMLPFIEIYMCGLASSVYKGAP